MVLATRHCWPDGHSYYKTVVVVGVVFSMLSLLLQLVGFVTQKWLAITAPTGFTVNLGVWHIQLCNQDNTCQTVFMNGVINPFNLAGDIEAADFISWVELQVEVTLAFVACITTVCMSVNALLSGTLFPKYLACCGIATSITSACLLMIPISRLLAVIHQWKSHVTCNTPLSLVFSALGCICMLFTAVINLCALCLIIHGLPSSHKIGKRLDDLKIEHTTV